MINTSTIRSNIAAAGTTVPGAAAAAASSTPVSTAAPNTGVSSGTVVANATKSSPMTPPTAAASAVIAAPAPQPQQPIPAGYTAQNEARLAQFANTDLTLNSGETLGTRRARRLTNVNVVGPYRGLLAIPEMPTCFPYNSKGIPAICVAVRFPVGTLNNLPMGVRQLLVQNNININRLEVNFCVQDMLLTWREQQILLRPHSFLHPNAPENAGVNTNYAATSNVLVGITDINSAFGPLANVPDIISHGENGGQVVFSIQQFPIQQVNPANGQAVPIPINTSHAFYSLCIEPSTGRAALTLHWLVNTSDYNIIAYSVLPISRTIQAFINNLAARNSTLSQSAANEISPLQALNALVHGNQPVAAQRASRYRIQEQAGLVVTPTPTPISIPHTPMSAVTPAPAATSNGPIPPRITPPTAVIPTPAASSNGATSARITPSTLEQRIAQLEAQVKQLVIERDTANRNAAQLQSGLTKMVAERDAAFRTVNQLENALHQMALERMLKDEMQSPYRRS